MTLTLYREQCKIEIRFLEKAEGIGMDAKVHELLNQQINKEFYSVCLYLDKSFIYAEPRISSQSI